MDEMLSQEELDALLASMGVGGDSSEQVNNEAEGDILSDAEVDAIGEIANICAGSSATNLSTVLNQKVNITTPEVYLHSVDELIETVGGPFVVVKINYVEGISGSNIQILYEKDAKIITDLMMGGDGTNLDALGPELTEMHMSALCEAMNQMTGAAATALSTMLGRRVDISPPTALMKDLSEQSQFDEVFGVINNEKYVTVNFRLIIGELIDSSYMQIYSVDFAKSLYNLFEENAKKEEEEAAAKNNAAVDTKSEPVREAEPVIEQEPEIKAESIMPDNNISNMGIPQGINDFNMPDFGNQGFEAVNVMPAEFSEFDKTIRRIDRKEQIDIIDDVSLEITVELGKAQKSVQEILNFEEGTLVELDRFTGEMMDILVNGKIIAKGEVVVLEDKFAVQLKEINVDGKNQKERRGTLY